MSIAIRRDRHIGHRIVGVELRALSREHAGDFSECQRGSADDLVPRFFR